MEPISPPHSSPMLHSKEQSRRQCSSPFKTYRGWSICQAPSLPVFALNTEMRWCALQAGRIYIQQHPGDAQLTVDELRDMAGRQGEAFSNIVLHCAASLQGTRQYWFRQRGQLISMVDTLGLPTIFFTHSAADLHGFCCGGGHTTQMFTEVQQCIYKYIPVKLACTTHFMPIPNIYFYHSRRREISHSHLTPSHSEHKKNGCSSAREQLTFSLTAAHKRTSTRQQLHKPTLTWKRRLPSLQGTDSKQHHTPSQHLQVQTVSKDASWRSTPQLRTTLKATAPHLSG